MRGGRTEGCTRLTALPESRRAWKGRPFSFTSTRGAAFDGARCTAQPASHAHGGSVGIGSSQGSGTAGLLTAPGPPSGEKVAPAPQPLVLGGLRQLDGLDELREALGAPYASRLPKCSGKGTEEFIYYYPLCNLSRGRVGGQQPVVSETCELPASVFLIVETFCRTYWGKAHAPQDLSFELVI